MDNGISLDYYYGKEADQFRFIAVPIALFEEPYKDLLTSDAKLLYSFMLNRMGLSIKNKWVDEKGRPYIIFTNATICEKLGCKKDKARKLLDELASIGFIERIPGFQGSPDLIYVKNFCRSNEEGEVGKTDPSEKQMPQIYAFPEEGGRKNRGVPVGKTDSNDIDNNYITRSNDPSSQLSPAREIKREERDEAYRQIIRENIEYDHFMSSASLTERGMFHDLYEIICDVVCSDGDYIMIKREKKPYEVVRKKFLDIGSLEMEYAIQHLSESTSAIRKPREYAIATLYDASLSANLSITHKVHHDMAHPDVSDNRSFG